jgi:hypothetical protein
MHPGKSGYEMKYPPSGSGVTENGYFCSRKNESGCIWSPFVASSKLVIQAQSRADIGVIDAANLAISDRYGNGPFSRLGKRHVTSALADRRPTKRFEQSLSVAKAGLGGLAAYALDQFRPLRQRPSR